MNDDSLLLRQVHPTFVQNGTITSQVFRPTPKDENQLSVDNGDKISAKNSFDRFCSQPDCNSAGVMAVSCKECKERELEVIEDGVPTPEHCSIDFTGKSRKQVEKIAKYLKRQATDRGWQYQPS